jgi:hypothetical protein
VGKHLNFGLSGKVLEGNTIAANPALAGEIRPSGMRGGLAETLVMVELGTRRTTERVRVGHSPPKAERVVFLLDPFFQKENKWFSFI